jgi:ABC-type branched-subunit amino acid transport system ATPase component
MERTGLLTVEALDVRYLGVRALTDVSFVVPDGEIVAVLGNNGAGKSTLLRAISGTLAMQGGTIAAGRITFAGRRIDGLDPAEVVHAGVVQVPEGRRVFKELTVEENLRSGGLSRRRRTGKEATTRRIYELFPRLEERRSQRAGLLSGGEQQMLAIGRALMAQPRLLLLDEPSLGLAPQIVERIGETIVDINAQGTSVVLVEQNAAMALKVADRASVLEVGRIALAGTAAALAESDEVKARYLGIAPEGEVERVTAAPVRRITSDVREPKALEARNVTVRFGGILALEDVSLTVTPGTTHAVIGPNGAGKSTLMNVVTGVYKVTAGRVGYGDAVISHLRPPQIAALGISRTFQNLAVSPRSTVQENLLLGRHRHSRANFFTAGLRLPRARRELAEQTRIVDAIAELVGLGGKEDACASDLPYGDLKRLELARALCAEPSLLLLDEPVAGMNHDESREMGQTIAKVRETLGISIVVVDHDMPFVMGLAETITVLDFGRVIAVGTPAEVQADAAVVAAYLGREGDGVAA